MSEPLEEMPVLEALASNLENLYELGKSYGYQEDDNGYISKCHLCVDIRKYLVKRTSEFKELKPLEFYKNLDKS